MCGVLRESWLAPVKGKPRTGARSWVKDSAPGTVRSVRILFCNHTGLVSGAERSLLELVGGLHARGEEVLVASPAGPLGRHVAALGVPHEEVPGTTASFKLGVA